MSGPQSAPPGAEQIADGLTELALDPAVHGVICQTPLPPGVDLPAVASAIPVGQDVDGANPASLGGLAAGLPGVSPRPPPPRCWPSWATSASR